MYHNRTLLSCKQRVSPGMRVCSECGYRCSPDEFSNNQWRKGPGVSRCMDCVERTEHPVECSVCLNWYSSDNALAQHMKTHPICEYCDEQFFSREVLEDHLDEYHNICDVCNRDFRTPNGLNQHRQIHPECDYCDERFMTRADVLDHMDAHHNICQICGRDFQSQNDLFQHSKTHLPRTVSCPLCGEKKFKSGANAVSHVESGYCTACRGQETALRQIHRYVSRNAPQLCTPMLEYGSRCSGVPDQPYRCTYCNKSFRLLSAQMNHENDVHGNDRRPTLGW